MALAHRFSFRSKMFLSYMLIVLIPVSICAAWVFNQVVLPIRGERLQAIEQTMDGLRSGVMAATDDIERTGYLISTNIVLKKALLKRYYDESEIIEVMNTSIQSLLSWFSATHLDYGRFHFLTVNETLPESDFFIPASVVSSAPWFALMQDRLNDAYPYWEPWHIRRDYPYGKSDGSPVYSMFYSINENYPDEVSYLEFEVDIDRLYARLDDAALGQSGFVAALAWDGSSRRLPSQADGKAEPIIGMPVFANADLSVETTGTLSYGGASYRYLIKPIERLGTSFVGIVPEAELNGPWHATRNVFLLLIASLTVLLAALSYWLAWLLIRKVQRIAAGVRRIRNGNFDTRIEARGEDEIDGLARNVNAMAGQIGELIERVYKSQVTQKEAELRALQAQIHPHFLFNALETLRMMAETQDQRRLSDAIAALGGMMRYNLAQGREMIDMATEIEHLRDYVHIHNLLNNNRITLVVDASDALDDYRMPSLLLQPLVENSILHGMKGLVGRLTVRIEAAAATHADGTPLLMIRVADDGVGIQPERLALLRARLATVSATATQETANLAPEAPGPSLNGSGRGGGVGLGNIADRIRHGFGPTFGLTLESEEGRGTVVTLSLPARPQAEKFEWA